MSDKEKFIGEKELIEKMEKVMKENNITFNDIELWLDSKGYSVVLDEDIVS